MNYLNICLIILIIGLSLVIFILCIKNKNKCVKSRDLLSCPKLSQSSNIESDVSGLDSYNFV